MNTYELKIMGPMVSSGSIIHYIETEESELEIRLREICSFGVLAEKTEGERIFIPPKSITSIRVKAIERSQYLHQDSTIAETIKEHLRSE